MNRIQVILLILIISSEQNIWANSGFKFKSRNCSILELICLVGNCESAKKEINSGICYAHINLAANASDNCSLEENLVWEYQIDLNNDGIGIYNGFDLKVSKLSKKNYLLGALPSINDNIYANKIGYPFDASGTYPLGTHRICWSVENVCGDKTECCKIFIIKDCEAPTPICITGFKTFDLPFKGLEIFAKELDNGSYDNCTLKENLLFYFDGEPSKTSIKVTCEDFIKALAGYQLRLDLDLWIEDESGNIVRCNNIVIIRDSENLCPDDAGAPSIFINGEIRTLKNEIISKTETRIDRNGSSYVFLNTNPFNFTDYFVNQQNTYLLIPSRNDDHLNGVSTADIVKIQKHVIGKVKLNSPYLLIAADLNNSKSITTADISEIRKLVLGVREEFTRVKSWVFIPMNYKFPDPELPFDAPRTMSFSYNNNKTDTANFVGIKMGDVNESASASNFEDKLMVRSNSNISLRTTQDIDQLSNRMLVNFYLDSIFSFNGIQFTFHFDKNLLDWNSFESGQLKLEDENINVLNIDQGIITFSWDAYEALNIRKGKPLFSFIFRNKTDNLNNCNFSFSDHITKSEIYDEDLNAFQLKLENNNDKNNVDKIRNLSNPWFNSGKIFFILNDTESQVELIVYDKLGKKICRERMNGEYGINSFELDRAKVQDSGIYYFEIITKRESKSGKMIVY